MAENSDDNNLKGLLSGYGLSLTGKPCDNCNSAAALLYCRSDTAFLCGPCDAKIHTGLGHGHHERVWICEVCEQAPAVVTCKADAAALCSSCDHDIHSANPLANRHERSPITPFLDGATARSTAIAVTSSAFLVAPGSVNDIDDVDTWLIPNPSSSFIYDESDIMNFGYDCQNLVKSALIHQEDRKPIVVNESRIDYAFTSDSVVPTQSQGNNNNFVANCMDYTLFEDCFDIDFSQPNKFRKKNNNNLFTSSFNSAHQSVSSSDIGVVPEGNTNSITSEVSYSFGGSTAVDGGATTGAPSSMDREARVLRYREKRKNRKFEKTIRYASRKAYAETRPRVKGRFVKRTESNEIETSELDCVVDHVYGVVPTF